MATGEVFISRKICTTYEHPVCRLKSVPGQLRPPGFMFALRHFHICFPSLKISVVETPDVFLHLQIVKNVTFIVLFKLQQVTFGLLGINVSF